MARILYLDCFSGISGDMMLGALLDAGLPLAELQRALGSLAVTDYHISAERVLRAGVSATRFRLHEHHGQPEPAEMGASAQHAHAPSASRPDAHRHAPGHEHGHDGEERERPGEGRDVHGHRRLSDIFRIIGQSQLAPAGRDRARALFERLAEAEAAIHHTSNEEVHLHEVGALDSIIDIVGVVFGLDWFEADRVVCSPLNVGGGTVRTAHGVLPVPAPATVRLLTGAPIYSGTVQHELVTPTGALIATSYATSFGAIPPMTVERVGYGAGDRDFPDGPNVLRLLVGHAADRPGIDRVSVIECEIDDMNPQIFGVVMEQLYAAGALEVFYVPVQMKKNRPGTLLTVVAPTDRRAALSDIVFRETTTIGLRYGDVDRECLPRETITVATAVGDIRFKIARRGGRIVNAAPEFEDVASAAAAHHLSVKDVQALAVRAYGEAQAADPLPSSS